MNFGREFVFEIVYCFFLRKYLKVIFVKKNFEM